MSDVLPKWVIDDIESVRLEAAPYREMTLVQRQVLLAAACKAAARMLRSRDDAEEVLAYTDPIPESSKQALARLRREAKEKHDLTAREYA